MDADTLVALVRPVSPQIGAGERTHVSRTDIDLPRARREHADYVHALHALDVAILELPALPNAPDGVFVEDCAVVTAEIAIVTRPGAASRRVEVPSVATVLQRYRQVERIAAPGTLDGGDVLCCGRDVFVGRSGRSNDAGTSQLAAALEPLGYRVVPVPLAGCLHLKSAVTLLPDGALIHHPAWVDATRLGDRPRVAVPVDEPRGANVLSVRGRVLVPADCPVTIGRLEERGYDVVPVACGELAKAEGGLTCSSIVFAG